MRRLETLRPEKGEVWTLESREGNFDRGFIGRRNPATVAFVIDNEKVFQGIEDITPLREAI